MEKEYIKTFVNDTFSNIAGEYIENISEDQGDCLLDMFEELMKNDDDCNEKLEKILKKMGISEDLIPSLTVLNKSLKYFVKFFEESFESLHDSICSISFQMHTDKIERAKQARKQFERALNAMNPSERVKILLNSDFDGKVVSDLFSDLKGKVYEIKEISQKGKKTWFGWKKVYKDLAELKETLPVYVDIIFLTSVMYLYLGEISNAQNVLRDAQEKINSLFPYNRRDENRLYTLTDEAYWIEVPQKYCDEFEKSLHQIEILGAIKNKLIE